MPTQTESRRATSGGALPGCLTVAVAAAVGLVGDSSLGTWMGN